MSCTDLETYRLQKLADLDADTLERDLGILIWRYQRHRARHLAQSVLGYLEALSGHPALDGGDRRRCFYRRLALQWRVLVLGSGERQVGRGNAISQS